MKTNDPKIRCSFCGKTEEQEPLTEFFIELTGGGRYYVPVADLERYRKLYPAVSVEKELRKMAGWIMANGKRRRKNPTGAKMFIANWLARSQDRPSTFNGTQQTQGKVKGIYTVPDEKVYEQGFFN